MREKIRDKDRLTHILLAINNINKFLSSKSQHEFNNDPILYHAIVNNLSIIGEASYKLSKEFIDSHPHTPWKQIINMRHFLVHGYYQVSKKIIWDTCKLDLSDLQEQIELYIKEL